MAKLSYQRLMVGLLASAVITVIAAACLGRYMVSPVVMLRALAHHWQGKNAHNMVYTVLSQVRFPRVAMAFLVGANLSSSGVCYQSMFRNPLVSPFILGISGGAGFGAAVAILLLGGSYWIYVSAFCFAVIAVLLSMLLGGKEGQHSTLVLVLSGIVVGSVFTALLALLKYTADPDNKLPIIEYWLMGSLSDSRPNLLLTYCVFTMPAMALLWWFRWRLNLLSNSGEISQSLGINVKLERGIFIAIATILASASVAVSGIIGWVGLVIPHLGRLLVGPCHRKLVPVSFFLGGTFLLVCDTVARSSVSYEIPLGVITALLGAPIFALLLRRGHQSWN